MKKLRARASAAQAAFVNSAAQFPAFVGGFGSGKTQAAILRALRLKLAAPKQRVAYYLPSYDLVRRIAFPRFAEVLDAAGLGYTLSRSEHVLSLHNRGEIIFRTLDRPERIIGYEVADSIVDELDTLKRAEAERAWQQIIARNRQKKPGGSLNTVGVATTPEGFRFVYQRWHQAPAAGYELIRASTESNRRNLPAGYIEALKQSYPPQLIAAYLDGQFVNLTSGAVYPDFDRVHNHTAEEIAPNEELHVGLDFNVYNCTAIIAVIRAGQPRVLSELTKLRDTPHVIATLREKFAGHKIYVYPDASGHSNKTVNASDSDIALLSRAGFAVRVPSKNPLVKERVLAVNSMLCNASGQRSLRVNTTRCPVLTECLEQQVYDANGEPDKAADRDHAPDALGYLVHYHWPIVRPAPARNFHLPHMGR